MSGTAEEIPIKTDPLQIRLFRKKGKQLFLIALYNFETPLTIAQIIHFLNSKSKNKILEGYLEELEEVARLQCMEALGERRV